MFKRLVQASVLTVGALGVALVLAGCGLGSPAPAAVPLSSAEAPSVPIGGTDVAASPVPVLRATGAVINTSVVSGQYDIYGNRYADGTFLCDGTYEQITVHTFPTNANLMDYMSKNPIDDSHVTIRVNNQLTTIEIVAVDELTNGAKFCVTPAAIAKRVGGIVIPPTA